MNLRRGPLLPALCLIALLAVGCNRSLPKDELDRAREAVETGLTAWQKGEKPETLATGPKAIQFTEELWKGGQQLVSFQIKQTVGERKEGVVRCFVVLSLRDQEGKTSERDVAYQVTSKSPVLVARDPYF